MLQPEDVYPSRIKDSAEVLPRVDPVIHPSGIDGSELLGEADIESFNEKGYLLLPNTFTATEVEMFRAELERMQNDISLLGSPEAITEPDNGELRSVFQIHKDHPVFSNVAKDPRIADIARFILGGDVYIHQSRLNFKPGYRGREFYWHSDFETWHVEDGMPRMRAVSCSILLTDNDAKNGALMLMPGSHKEYVTCVGETPDNHYLSSLKKQEYGVPSDESLKYLSEKYGIDCAEAKAGSVLVFDCNVMHGSNSNITPDPRSNLFFVYNHVDNMVFDPFCGKPPRPEFICSRETIKTI
ncbi:ectoine hydroxylase [Neptuniibacter caesariensis]|uniref:Ectoine hydroxylase n=1 Tax=Neptuniibacter caesariensis TaxID=207954 RepID=A0A7U8C296_NEPCE|nr:ectoine hydroxylase [Neptuniibacter caesariensis]EAR60183.1 putative L-proline 4-hydroxylase [Oceanospirillum sp. MED92] [Neptuniibacter caesariensis]